MASGQRPYKVGILGATGFTGQLVARQLASRYGRAFKWVMAARSPNKLKDVQESLALRTPAIQNGDMLTVDVTQPDTLDKLTSKCQAVINTAGPYTKYGSPVVESCIRNGTHYCDLSAELPWMRQTILEQHDKAEASNVKVVFSCGFDSIPSDITTWMAAKELYDNGCSVVEKAETLYLAVLGGISGGTLASVSQFLSYKGEAYDPYYLLPPEWPRGSDAGPQLGSGYNQILDVHTIPSPFSIVDTRIVHRSNAILGYGSNLQVDGGFKAPGRLSAMAVDAAIQATRAVGSLEPIEQLSNQIDILSLVRQFIPPGEGPPEWLQDVGFGGVKTTCSGTLESGTGIATATTAIRFEAADPGYKATSKMLLEVGLGLAEGENEQFGDCGIVQGGVLTPAAALGGALVTRLNNLSNFSVDVES